MIVVRLCGGLGNQLFQYATARRLALRHSTELVFDLGWYERTPKSDTPREYELDKYNVRGRTPRGWEIFWCRTHEGPVLRRLGLLPRRWKHHRERASGFDPSVLTLHDDVYLDGYWQSHQYFSDIERNIREELLPRIYPEKMDLEVMDLIHSVESIAVHVRRGDYVTNQEAHKAHGLCSREYYESASSYIGARIERPHFFVFSDDSAWARSNLSFPGSTTVVDHNGHSGAFQDLRLISTCKHQITANSSFSWWGAWLNANTSKIVVTPRQWFPSVPNTELRSPAEWIRI